MPRGALPVLAGVLGVIAAAVLAASALLDYGALERGVLARLPTCSARARGGSCALCGMSHSLVALSHGDWEAAVRWNAGGPWLYGMLAAHALAGGVVAANAARRRYRPRQRSQASATSLPV